MSPTVFLGAMVLFIGVIVGSSLVWVTRTVRVLRRRGVPVVGRVVSVRRVVPVEGSAHMESTVEYHDTFGTLRTAIWGYEIPTDTIDLLVDPQKPSRVSPAVTDPHSQANKITEAMFWVLIVASYAAAAVGVLLLLRVIDLD